jgi:hypothetical protein
MTAAEGRAARRRLEEYLDRRGWEWNPTVSKWLDGLLVVIEERGA